MVTNNQRPNQHSRSTSPVLGGGLRPGLRSSTLTSARVGRVEVVRLRPGVHLVRILSSGRVLNGWGRGLCVCLSCPDQDGMACGTAHGAIWRVSGLHVGTAGPLPLARGPRGTAVLCCVWGDGRPAGVRAQLRGALSIPRWAHGPRDTRGAISGGHGSFGAPAGQLLAAGAVR